MSVTEILEVAAAIIASVGGAGVILLGLSGWIGKIFANKIHEKIKADLQQEIESYKTKLKKSEFLFQKEFDAASEIITLRQSIIPPYRFPDMDWNDACEEMAAEFERIEKNLKDFVAVHGAVLKQDTLDALSAAEGLASVHKFDIHNGEASREAIKAADKLWDKLEEVENQLRETVLSQSGI